MLITGIMATSKIVGSIFFATNEQFRVEKLVVSSSSDFINNNRIKIYKHSTRDMLSCTSFIEKGVESIITSTVFSLGIRPSGYTKKTKIQITT